MSGRLSGAHFAILAFLLFSLATAGVKQIGNDLPTFEIAFFRFLLGVIVLGCVAPSSLRLLVPKSAIGLYIARSLLGCAWIACSFYATPLLPLANVTALGYTSPLILAVLAGIVLRERIPVLRWVAIALGFTGVLIVARPEAHAPLSPALIILGGCICAAIGDLIVRVLAKTQSAQAITASYFGLSTLMFLPVVLFIWRTPSVLDWWLLAVVGVFGALAQLALAESLKRTAASIVAPFAYTSLAWAVLIGWFAWGERPTLSGIGGGLLTIADAAFVWVSTRKTKIIDRRD
jgi:drug/metabolite transporter (DMT)-like permease